VKLERVRFKRTHLSVWEYGIMLGGDKLIVDKDVNPVPTPIYDWASVGTFSIDMRLEDSAP
jgi:hypothetical protein